ncbi:MAG: DUF1257 domain-containing protein [Deltaproteobacteria bacterium]|nr:DUF1257 domain-containing protein [Deltaproteobacteria bacterium]
MSHYCEVQIELRDEAALVAALARLGFKREVIEVHQTPQTLYGWQNDARAQKAHVIIRRQHVGPAANDLGFERQADGRYRIWVSEYDRDRNGYNDAWLGRLKQAYGIEKTRLEAKKRGYRVSEQKMDDGRVRLVLRR